MVERRESVSLVSLTASCGTTEPDEIQVSGVVGYIEIFDFPDDGLIEREFAVTVF
jgi:hypothetical protein